MQLLFSKAKDNSQTFSVDGIFFHSTYSPLKEAERFLQSINLSLEPELLLFVEPGLNYYSDLLKKKFPKCKLICLRLFDQPLGDEESWDYCIKYSEITNLKSFLINNLGEEKLLSSNIIITKQAESIFKNQIDQIIFQYKNALEDSKTLLVTRQFFEKKWLINSCNFIKYANHFCSRQFQTDLPVLVCASGPSLNSCIKIIKENTSRLFIICLSSATSVLLENDIIPDIVLTTDGGWWAGEHLKLLKKHKDIPLATPCEAFIPKCILQKNPIFTFEYNDSSSFISCEILKKAHIQGFSVLRNPTVSGTALSFAKAITKNSIYFCGLDLAGGKGQQHTKPNEIEKDNNLNDFRIKNIETRTSYSRYNSNSLHIYRDWFCELNDVDNVYRVIDFENNKQGQLGKIKDISSKDFLKKIENLQTLSKANFFKLQDSNNNKSSSIIDYICEQLKSHEWQKQIFPADFISIKNCADENQKKFFEERINCKITKLIQKIRKLIDE